MADMTQVTLTDEDVRHLVRLILWNRAVCEIGEGFEDAAFVFADDTPEVYEMRRRETQRRMEAFAQAEQMTDAVDRARVGDAVEVPAEFAETVRSLRQGYMEIGGHAEDETERLLSVMRPAALRIEAQFAGAVA